MACDTFRRVSGPVIQSGDERERIANSTSRGYDCMAISEEKSASYLRDAIGCNFPASVECAHLRLDGAMITRVGTEGIYDDTSEVVETDIGEYSSERMTSSHLLTFQALIREGLVRFFSKSQSAQRAARVFTKSMRFRSPRPLRNARVWKKSADRVWMGIYMCSRSQN